MSTKKTNNSIRVYQIFFLALGIFCAGAIAFNLVVRRVPVHDATIESDLTAIASAIESYVAVQSFSPAKLPADLSELTELSAATKKRLGEYEYIPVSATQYQLCATFLAAGDSRNAGKSYGIANGYADPTQHGKGR